MPAAVPAKKSSKLWLWLGLGCVGLCIVSVIGTVIFMKLAVDEVGDSIETQIHRTNLSWRLGELQTACAMNSDLGQYFAPATASQTYRDQACQVTGDVSAAYADFTRSDIEQGDSGHAGSSGLTDCWTFTSASSKIVACYEGGTQSASTMKIVHLEGLPSVTPIGG
jgi:hypothetical protein